MSLWKRRQAKPRGGIECVVIPEAQWSRAIAEMRQLRQECQEYRADLIRTAEQRDRALDDIQVLQFRVFDLEELQAQQSESETQTIGIGEPEPQPKYRVRCSATGPYTTLWDHWEQAKLQASQPCVRDEGMHTVEQVSQ